MEKILEFEDFLPKNSYGKYSRNEIEQAAIEFAKYHVKEALKTASEKVEFDEEVLIRGSILQSYSLENIK